jgi:hypothetical protein
MKDVSQAFRRNTDGSWVCIVPATLDLPIGRIQVVPGTTFTKGTTFMGADVVEWLNEMDAIYGPRLER